MGQYFRESLVPRLCAALQGNDADGRPQLWPSTHRRCLNREQDSKAFLVLTCLRFCLRCHCYLWFVFILVCFGQRNIPVTCGSLCFSSGSVHESWGSLKSQRLLQKCLAFWKHLHFLLYVKWNFSVSPGIVII